MSPNKSKLFKELALASLQDSYDWEMKCGYDEITGMASVSILMNVVHQFPLIPCYPIYRILVLSALKYKARKIYFYGEYCNSIASMNSAISRIEDIRP